jgi:outer membrane protein TolC
MDVLCRLRLRPGALLCALVFAAGVSDAQVPLTLAEALRLAELRAPALAASYAAARGARESGIAAGQLPDPVLKAGVDNLPVDGSDAFSLTRDFMTMRRIGVMQEYVSAAKREARQARSVREASRWEAEADVSRAEIRTLVAIAWYERLLALRTERVVEELVAEIAMQERASQAQAAGGRAPVADVLVTRAALVQAEDRALAARRQQQVAAAKLARWLGPDADRQPADEPALPADADVAQLEAHDVHNIPELRMLASQVEVADAEIAVAREERSPNWTWEVSYQLRGSAYSNMVSVGVAVPLPIARNNRQDREVAARLAQRDRARELLEDAQRRHRAEFDTLRIELQALRDRARQLEATLVPIARQRVEATLAAYRGGLQNLSAVLEARRAEVDARLMVIDLQREAARVWAQLRFTYFEGIAG